MDKSAFVVKFKMFKIKNSIHDIKWYQKINKRGNTRKIRKGEIMNGKARVSTWHTKKLKNLKINIKSGSLPGVGRGR